MQLYKATLYKTGAMAADWACSLFQCTVHSTFDPGIPKILNRGPALFQHQIMDAIMDQLPTLKNMWNRMTYLLIKVIPIYGCFICYIINIPTYKLISQHIFSDNQIAYLIENMSSKYNFQVTTKIYGLRLIDLQRKPQIYI